MEIILGILVAIILICSYAIYNLLRKVENYEDVISDQVNYLQTISNLVGESKKHIETLDSQGTFQSDDEVGYFFNTLKEIQEELNKYMLPENYGKKKGTE